MCAMTIENPANPAARVKLAKSSLAVMLGALMVGLGSFGASAYFFTGFLGGGRSSIGVFQAFILCFMIGACFYLPAIYVFIMARRVRAGRASKAIGFGAVLISLPIWLYSAAALITGYPYALWLAGPLLIGILLLLWGLAVIWVCVRK